MESLEKSNALVLSTYNFRNPQDIQEIIDNPSFSREAKGQVDYICQKLNIQETIEKLSKAAKFLQLGYAGSKPFSCKKQVAGIIADYQILIGDSTVALHEFVQSCLSALMKLKFATEFESRGELGKSLNMISECSKIALELAETSKELTSKSLKLQKKAKKALQAALEDQTNSQKEKSGVTAQISQFQANKESLKQKLQDLAPRIHEEKEKEWEIAKEEKMFRDRAFALDLFAVAMEPVTHYVNPIGSAIKELSRSVEDDQTHSLRIEKSQNQKELEAIERELARKEVMLKQAESENDKKNLEVEIADLKAQREQKNQIVMSILQTLQKASNSCNEQAKLLNEREKEVEKRRISFQQDEREANAELARTAQMLKNLHVEAVTIDEAILVIDLAQKILGNVASVFAQIRLFWAGMATHCKKLANTENFITSSELGKERFQQILDQTKVNWLALGKVSFVASKAIEMVRKDVDNIMSNLPTQKEAKQIIDEMAVLKEEEH